jgi:glyoxylate carboligase
VAYSDAAALAAALRIRVSTENQPLLDACLDAAASEIDHDLDRTDPLPDPAPAAIARTNVNRAVEWYKAADAAYGIVGFEQVGLLHAPDDGFARHASTITPWKQGWGMA